MNDRIYEFATQAGAYCETYLYGGDPKPPVLEGMDLEKFAESIVQECIVQIQLTTARDPQYTAQYKQSVGHIHRIRRHFGIE